MENQEKKPPTVVKLTNQLKIRKANISAHWSNKISVLKAYLNTVAPPDETVMNDNKENAQAVKTATMGRPFFVHFARTLGACPRNANP